MIMLFSFAEFFKNPLNIILFGLWLRGKMIDWLGEEYAGTETFVGITIQVLIFIAIVGVIRWAIRQFKGK